MTLPKLQRESGESAKAFAEMKDRFIELLAVSQSDPKSFCLLAETGSSCTPLRKSTIA